MDVVKYDQTSGPSRIINLSRGSPLRLKLLRERFLFGRNNHGKKCLNKNNK